MLADQINDTEDKGAKFGARVGFITGMAFGVLAITVQSIGPISQVGVIGTAIGLVIGGGLGFIIGAGVGSLGFYILKPKHDM